MNKIVKSRIKYFFIYLSISQNAASVSKYDSVSKLGLRLGQRRAKSVEEVCEVTAAVVRGGPHDSKSLDEGETRETTSKRNERGRKRDERYSWQG